MALYIARLGVLTVSLVFSVIVLGLAANLTSETQTYFAVTYNFAALALASATISVVTLPVLLLVDILRNGAFTSMVVFELAWLFVLWVLWLATAALATQFNQDVFDSNCSLVRVFFVAACHQEQTIVAFAYLIWLILMVYTIVLLVMAIIGSSRGNKTWTTSVKHANFLGPNDGAVAPAGQPGYEQNVGPQTPMQQHQYPPPNAPLSPPPPTIYGTEGSHVSQVPSQGPSQGPAYV